MRRSGTFEVMASADGNSLPRRVTTAFVAAPIAVFAVLSLPTGGVAAVLALVAVAASVEWARITSPRLTTSYRFPLVVAVSLVLLWLVGQQWLGWLRILCAISLAWWCVALGWVIRFERGCDVESLDKGPVAGVAGWFVIVPAWAGLVYVHAAGDDGPLRVLFILLLVWAADIGAYFAGRRFGARKLAVRTSPGKSVEGAAGGLAAVAMLAIATGPWLGLALVPVVLLVALCVLVGAVSVLGDLTESLVKRRRGVKESGGLLPGHGGILDRIDSLTAAAPAFAVGYDVVGTLR